MAGLLPARAPDGVATAECQVTGAVSVEGVSGNRGEAREAAGGAASEMIGAGKGLS